MRKSLLTCCLLLAGLLSIQCASKEQLPPKSIFLRLNAGLSIESTKKIAADAGWTYLTSMSSPALTMITYQNVKFQDIQKPFLATLTFDSNGLNAFILAPISSVLYVPDTPPEHSLRDYRQMVQNLESIYGRPSDSGTTIKHQAHPGDRIDTTYRTKWMDSSRYYSVEYDALKGLNFNALMFGKK